MAQLFGTDGVRGKAGEFPLDVTTIRRLGAALVRALRSLNSDVKIICVSGLASEHKLAEIDKSQVQSFVTKPYTSATLLTTVRQVITSD